MSLMERIKVKTCYTRATNVERDAGCAANVCTYHPRLAAWRCWKTWPRPSPRATSRERGA